MAVSMVLVRALVGALERAGASSERMLCLAGIDRESVQDLQLRIPNHRFELVVLAALSVSDDEALGLHLAAPAEFGRFGLVENLVTLAPSLHLAFDTLVRFSRLVWDAFVPVVVHESDVLTVVRVGVDGRSGAAVRLMSELTVHGLTEVVRRFVGRDAAQCSAHFVHSEPTYGAEYLRCLGGAVHYEQPFTGISFPASWLERSQLYANESLYAELRRMAERSLLQCARDTGLTERVLGALSGCDPAQVPPMDEIARCFGISERTMRRRLAAEGTFYRDLVERMRAQAAKRFLERESASIHECAAVMGFSTPGPFFRAFKRWTGMTPNEYRLTI